ncbi:uncharacterized protein K02A2.6-like [Hemicordylus capensis]|uniref:uncharacterized protein K02A2.6-like n=1 Tax=Hemicordylus capensis TaxID=884348 RepID=UPI0023035F3E|nr:uncharacterized protein K02A2.6-like [Hemicordylus capensis]
MGNGKEAPIAFYSRSLTQTERNYAQIDREALAIIAGTRKFHDFIYGRKFTIVSDHKHLLGIFVQGKQTPQILSPRMLRWAMFLQAYDFNLIHRPGAAISHADALSRSPMPSEVLDEPGHQVLMIEALPGPPVTAVDIARETGRDPMLARVQKWVQQGWPAKPPADEFRVFHQKKDKLSLEHGCLLWGQRVVIPEGLRHKVLRVLHISHPGIVKSKALARSYFWWPRLDLDVGKWIGRCAECKVLRPEEPQLPLREWDTARGPWSRIHVDFAGPFKGSMFLLAVDAYSKWLEVIPVVGTTSTGTIRKLWQLFSTFGLPDVLVTDNASTFM